MAFDPIELEVLWQSLIATVNEQARVAACRVLPIVREAGDLANAVFDRARSDGCAGRHGDTRPHQLLPHARPPPSWRSTHPSRWSRATC